MKTLILAVAVLLIAAPSYGQTVTVEIDTTDAQSKVLYDSLLARKAALVAVASQAIADSLNASRSAALAAFGMTFLKDTADPAWVRISLPLAQTPPGNTKMFLVAAIQEMKDDGAKDVDVGVVRTSHGNAIKARNRMELLLAASQ